MTTRFQNASIYYDGKMQTKEVLVSEGGLAVFDQADEIPQEILPSITETISLKGCVLLPGFADVHVHFREPGFSYKGTIATGSASAARGGFTTVLTMPNLNPIPATVPAVEEQLALIRRDSKVEIRPYGTITKLGNGRSQLADMEAIAPLVAAYSDDGRGVQTKELMRDAMEVARGLGKIIAAHCEDESLVGGTACHDGEYAKSIGIQGITSESEWRQIERDIKLADETGCAYHVCHISTKEGVEIIRDAKKSGVNVTCETGPHYLTLTDMDLAAYPKDGPEIARFKMYPPLRSAKDRDALIAGMLDGTIDMIATDHAPHSVDEKTRGLMKSANGIIGLETAFPVMYTKFVETGILSLEKLVELMSINPRKRFDLGGLEPFLGLHQAGGLGPDFTVIDLETPYTIDPEDFASKGRSTPFEGWEVKGKTVMTYRGGKKIYG